MFITHTAIAFWHHFHPWITKNMDLETVSHFGIPNHRKITKSPQSDSKGTPQMILKSLKIHTWTSKCLLGDPLDPRITKMVSLVLKKVATFNSQPVNSCLLTGRQWHAGVLEWPRCHYSRTPFSKMTVLEINSYPCQQSTGQQLPADRGPAAGAKP